MCTIEAPSVETLETWICLGDMFEREVFTNHMERRPTTPPPSMVSDYFQSRGVLHRQAALPSVVERATLLLGPRLNHSYLTDKYPGGIKTRFKHDAAQWASAAKRVKESLLHRLEVNGWKSEAAQSYKRESSFLETTFKPSSSSDVCISNRTSSFAGPVVNVEDAGHLEGGQLDAESIILELEETPLVKGIKEAQEAIKDTEAFLKRLNLL
jgi:hypothetical protein